MQSLDQIGSHQVQATKMVFLPFEQMKAVKGFLRVDLRGC